MNTNTISTLCIFVGIFVSLFSSYACSRLAAEKGYSGFSGCITGFFWGVLGLIYYAGLPDKHTQDAIKKLAQGFTGISFGR